MKMGGFAFLAILKVLQHLKAGSYKAQSLPIVLLF